jgi:hypothetical protein
LPAQFALFASLLRCLQYQPKQVGSCMQVQKADEGRTVQREEQKVRLAKLTGGMPASNAEEPGAQAPDDSQQSS